MNLVINNIRVDEYQFLIIFRYEVYWKLYLNIFIRLKEFNTPLWINVCAIKSALIDTTSKLKRMLHSDFPYSFTIKWLLFLMTKLWNKTNDARCQQQIRKDYSVIDDRYLFDATWVIICCWNRCYMVSVWKFSKWLLHKIRLLCIRWEASLMILSSTHVLHELTRKYYGWE